MGLRIVGGDDAATTAPRISLCMIVRDEEANLGRCLRSVEGEVDEIIVVDTGSTDRTVAIAERHGARVLHEEWRNDFAGPRNVSLDAATGDWILVLDADEELVCGGLHLRDLAREAGHLEGYYLRNVSYLGEKEGIEAIVNAQLRLFRNRPAYRYDRALHEQISNKLEGTIGEVTRLVGSMEIRHYGYLMPAITGREKTSRNRRIALEEALRKPDDSFTLFNAGTEYQRVGDDTKALYCFRQSFSNLPNLRQTWAPVLIRAMAISLRRLGRAEDALAILWDGQEAYPTFSDLYYIEAEIHIDRLEYRAAIAALERAVAIGEQDAVQYGTFIGMGSFHSLYGLGSLRERLGSWPEAVRCYARAVSESGGCFPAAQSALVGLCLKADPPDEVRDYVLRQLPERQRADSLRVVAEAFASAGHPDHALELVDMALQIEPSEMRFRIARAGALLALGLTAEAVVALDGIPVTGDLGPLVAERRFMAALIDGDRSAAEDAISLLAEATDGPAAAVYAEVLAETWREGASAALPESVRADAVPIAFSLATLLLELGQFDGYNAAIRVLYALVPDPALIDETVGIMLFDAGYPDPAAARLIAAVGAGAITAEGLARLAELAVDQGLEDDAENFLRAALEIDEENPQRYLDLVRLLARGGRYADAEQVVGDGLMMHPHSTVFTELQESLGLMAASRN